MLAAQVRAADQSFSGSACAGAKIDVISIAPVKVVDQPQVIAWREKVRLAGCDRSAVENLNIGRLGGAPPWRMTSSLPGDSLASATLQQTTLAAAVAQTRVGLPADCQGQKLNDVYVAARPGEVDISLPGAAPSRPRPGHPAISLPDSTKPMIDRLAPAAAWMEVWPFEVCGQDRTLGVVFSPLKDQTASVYLFLPIWQQIAAHGDAARPPRAE
jgi:hypothetical protein